MVRQNNTIPFGHFHKKWQPYVKTWFNQPARKLRRSLKRSKKAKNSLPQPIDKFRPTVRCPTVRYHNKTRLGRGFSLKELKAIKMSPKYARSIGIAVDHRRRNISYEHLNLNVQLLKEYQSRLILLPKKNWQEKLNNKPAMLALKNSKVKAPPMKLKAMVPTEEMKIFKAYLTLRKARADLKYFGKRQKLEKLKLNGMDFVKSQKKMRKSEIVE